MANDLIKYGAIAVGGEEAASKAMNELFLEKLKQEDPNKQMGVMVQLITAMKAMTPETKPDNTLGTIMPMFMTMIQQMNEAANRQFQMMMEMMKSNNKVEPKEESNELDKLRAIIELSKEIKGGGGGTHEKSVTESIIELGKDILPPVLNIVGNIMAMNAAAKGVSGVAAPPQTNGTSRTSGNTIDAINEANRQNMQQPSVQQPQQQIMPPTNESMQAQQLIQSFEPVIISHLAGEGWEFGAWVAQGYGDIVAASLAKMGVDKLMVAAKSVPSFWQKIEASYGEAHLAKWLDELCRYKEIMLEMDKEEERGNG
jgi:hypothetical protein